MAEDDLSKRAETALKQLIEQIDSKTPDRPAAMKALGKLMQMSGSAPIMCREGRHETPSELDAETYTYIEHGAEWITCRHKKRHTYKVRDLVKGP